ncbi:unnamed protein product [Linum tenue]|uniref:Cytidyltransferase-like domain-containing protein n=1 Tax=Linum tenue TaxID=586396 RepID=A0AAV0N647_9ROSI|nr:unnamed protein product [Linum tenue]
MNEGGKGQMKMTEAWIRAVVEAIHSTPSQAVIYLSGGASQSLGLLMSFPGATSTVLEALVPYSRVSMVDLLGKIPASYCSQQTAEEMALLAYNRALKLSSPGNANSRAGRYSFKSILTEDSPNGERKIILPGSFNPLHDGHLKLLEPKYYDGSYEKMLEILGACKARGCTFLVGGRSTDGVFKLSLFTTKVLGDLEIPEELKDMFVPIPAEMFRMDISSTEIRKSRGMM